MSIQARQGFAALRGLVYGSAFVFLWAWLATVVRRYDAGLPVSLPSPLRALGFVIAGLGGVITVSCIAVFASRGEGTPLPLDAPRKFVATGPYRYVRNPMYVGAILVLVGAGFAVLSPSIVLLGFAFWGLTHLLVLVYEEPVLTAKFGDAYTRYKAEVNRWLPRASGGL